MEDRFLWAAVLLSALVEYQEPVKSLEDLSERRKLLRWFRDEESRHVGSFGWICQVLFDRMSPGEVWRRLKKRLPFVDYVDVLSLVSRGGFYGGGEEVAA